MMVKLATRLRRFGRKLRHGLQRPAANVAAAVFPVNSHEVSPPALVAFGNWAKYLGTEFNKEGMKVLEVGSRVVTGANHRSMFQRADYTGFGFYAGENVDVVGDAHKLSSYFSGQEQFDLIFSSAVFEHLHMPWVVAEEIGKLLKVGGTVLVETHFSFSAHERPWNFLQFSDQGLRALFNKGLGFEVLDCGMSNPINGFFAKTAHPSLRYTMLKELYCHSEILAKKTRQVENFDWRQVEMDDVVAGTRYPKPKLRLD